VVAGPAQALLYGRLHDTHVEDLHGDAHQGMDADIAFSGPASHLQLAELFPVEGQHQMRGGRKIAVQRTQRDIGFCGNFGKSDGLKPFAGESGGFIQDPGVAQLLAREQWRSGHGWQI
jgi:hypothetical protein